MAWPPGVPGDKGRRGGLCAEELGCSHHDQAGLRPRSEEGRTGEGAVLGRASAGGRWGRPRRGVAPRPRAGGRHGHRVSGRTAPGGRPRQDGAAGAGAEPEPHPRLREEQCRLRAGRSPPPPPSRASQAVRTRAARSLGPGVQVRVGGQEARGRASSPAPPEGSRRRDPAETQLWERARRDADAHRGTSAVGGLWEGWCRPRSQERDREVTDGWRRLEADRSQPETNAHASGKRHTNKGPGRCSVHPAGEEGPGPRPHGGQPPRQARPRPHTWRGGEAGDLEVRRVGVPRALSLGRTARRAWLRQSAERPARARRAAAG